MVHAGGRDCARRLACVTGSDDALGAGGRGALGARAGVVRRATRAGAADGTNRRHDRRVQPAHPERAAGAGAAAPGPRRRAPSARPVRQCAALHARVQRPGARAGRRSPRSAARTAALFGDFQHEPGSVFYGRPRHAAAPGGGGRRGALTRRPDTGRTARRDRDPAASAHRAAVSLVSRAVAGPARRAGNRCPRLGGARPEPAHRSRAPLRTPKALTRAPGHAFPHLADRRVNLAVMLRDGPDGPPHFATVELPPSLPRFLAVSGESGGVVALETLVRVHLDTLFARREILEAHAFRVTRSGDIQLDELGAASFVQAVAEEVRRRPWGPVVRLEVERAMPPPLRELLQRELRFEESELASALGPSDVYAANGPVHLGAVTELAGAHPRPELDYPPLAARDPFPARRSVFDALDSGDVLVHHPYDGFAESFERLIAEAADDPAVAAIKLTLYRPGGPSALGDALRRAAARGKDVSVFVELKARFDEELNIGWAQSLEAVGIHVITGVATLKTHAKIALVIRRTGDRTRRYAHVGSGNYNPDTARLYTDLGLFTADEEITADLHALFNELTGSSRAPRAAFRRLLVAPTNMLDRFLALIAREAEHARAGRGGHIRAKLNGLADCSVIGALYRASQAGVDVRLVVRGVCMLRPGVPGLSARIKVVSVLGRFLEHARIYHFGNGGAPEYYIGSADWRPCNLRRRIEVVTPVDDAAARERLDGILERELADPDAWRLASDGSYARGVRITHPSRTASHSSA